MNFFLAVLAYLALGALIGIGLLKAAATGSFTILVLGIAVFFGLFVKAGCLSSHD